MSYAILDVETTITNNGHPFTPANRLCYVGIRTNNRNYMWDIEYSSDPYGNKLKEIRNILSGVDCIVGFNLKFDLHWLKRYLNDDIDFSKYHTYDCQLTEYLLSSQRLRMPSLSEICAFYDLGAKLDVIRAEYWDLGIDTDKIPRALLMEYLQGDLELTEKLYLKQQELLTNKSQAFKNLVWMQNEDTKVLQEMEYNGIKVDLGALENKKQETQTELDKIDNELREISRVAVNGNEINFSSTAHLSAIIYGGYINRDGKRIKSRTLKSGETVHREVNCVFAEAVEGFASPIKGSETKPTKGISSIELAALQAKAKEAFEVVPYRKYSVDEQTLKQIRPRTKSGRRFIELLLLRANLEQIMTTYLNKIPTLIQTNNWQDNIIHGQFNQCVARTGRLSSSNPNLQNFDSNLHNILVTRYAN